MRSAKRRLILGGKLLLVFIGSGLVLASAFEAYLRLQGFLEAAPAPYPCITGHPVLNHVFRENCEAVAPAEALKTERNVSYRTNSKGLRGEEPLPGKSYVAIVGDSYAEGFGLEESETLPARIQTEWRRAGRADVQVLNGGTVGFSTVMYPLYFQEKLAKLRPGFVLLNLDFTDPIDDSYFLGIAEFDASGLPSTFSPKETFPKWLLPYVYGNRSALLRFVHQEWNQWNIHRLGKRNRPAMEAYSAAASVPSEWLEKSKLTGCRKILAAVVRSVRLLRERVVAAGGRLGIHMYPPGAFVKKYSAQPQGLSFVRAYLNARRTDHSWGCGIDERFVEFVRLFAASEGIPFHESFTAVKSHPGKELLYFDRDAHWNGKGTAFVAARLAAPLWRSVVAARSERKR